MTKATTVGRWHEAGASLRRLRRRVGISQERLAEQVGTTRRHMIRLENGEHLPSGALRDRITEALGVPRESLQSSDGTGEVAA